MEIIKKIRNKITNFIQYPIKKIFAKRIGIKEFKNYSNSFIFIDNFNNNSVAIDVGCAQDADFSKIIIEKYGILCFGIDPTLKHQTELRALENEFKGFFRYLPLALSFQDKMITFYESKNNQSGSLMQNHVNVKNDDISEYKVQGIRIPSLLNKLKLKKVDLLKLDIEGAEYELLINTKSEDLQNIDQIFIEFHHHAISTYTTEDTKFLVRKLVKCGYNSFTYDNHNFLFYRDHITKLH